MEQKIVEDQLGSSMMNHVKDYRELLSRTPVHCVDVEERPSVVFRVSDNTWLEAIVRYLVHPKDAGRVKTELTRKLLAALNRQPERV
ncbi:MAG TPA: mechanosensitive ion channel family protein, partial [Verrucomicrobiae bacterium]|nr:mechanosensitive ion channel family protein [Verrucomicrobiae bacterium]